MLSSSICHFILYFTSFSLYHSFFGWVRRVFELFWLHAVDLLQGNSHLSQTFFIVWFVLVVWFFFCFFFLLARFGSLCTACKCYFFSPFYKFSIRFGWYTIWNRAQHHNHSNTYNSHAKWEFPCICICINFSQQQHEWNHSFHLIPWLLLLFFFFNFCVCVFFICQSIFNWMRIKYEADGINSMEIWIGNSTYVHASAAAALLPRFFSFSRFCANI